MFNFNGWAIYDTERSREQWIEATCRRLVSSTTVTTVENDIVGSVKVI